MKLFGKYSALIFKISVVIIKRKSWGYRNTHDFKSSYGSMNQLEKLGAAKAACLVCLSLLSLTGSFWVNFYLPYQALRGITGPY